MRDPQPFYASFGANDEVSHAGGAVLTKNHAQEGLSRAYMHAVSSTARVWMSMKDEFDYGFDGQLDLIADERVEPDGRRHLVKAGYAIDFQLKCSQTWNQSGGDIVWSIKSSAYNKLAGRGPGAIPGVLILMCLPPDETQWAEFSEDSLLLRKCCYFTTISGPRLENDNSTKQIKIPRSNLLDSSSLLNMLEQNRTRLDSLFTTKAG